jgi:hypothetical protein
VGLGHAGAVMESSLALTTNPSCYSRALQNDRGREYTPTLMTGLVDFLMENPLLMLAVGAILLLFCAHKFNQPGRP